MITREQLWDAYNKLEQPNANAQEVYEGLVKVATEDLDAIMQEIYTNVVLAEDVPFDTLQKLYAKLGNYIYYIGERLEKIGLSADVSEHSMKERYNAAYNDNLINPSDNKKRTANELTAIAEEASMSEAVLNDLYMRAYKTVKFKVDSALGMVNTLSRLFSKKMQELNFSSQFDNSRLLME